MKKYFKIFVFILFLLFQTGFIFAQETYLDAMYEYQDIDESAFLNGDFVTYYCIVLFKDGRYVRFNKIENKHNALDVKYVPVHYGRYNIHDDLLFLQAEDSSLQCEIFIINANAIVGSYSEYRFIKKK